MEILSVMLWGIFLYAVTQEVTRRQVEEGRDRLRDLVETTADWIWEADHQGGITYSSPRVRDILGYEPSEMLGRTPYDLVPDDDAERLRALGKEVRGGNHHPFNVKLSGRHKDGRVVITETAAVPVFDRHGRLSGYRGVTRDVTHREEAERALRQAKEELERQNQELRNLDRIKDGILQDVSHELKTPVAKQAMQLELLREALPKEGIPPPVGRIMGVMSSSVRRQEEVIRNMLDLYRLEGGGRKYRREPCRLDEVLRQVIEDYRPLLDAQGITVVASLDEVTVESDGEMLWHVFSNLLNNAVKFHGPSDPRIELTLRKDGDRALVTIRDNGLGMSPVERERAFDRFYKGERFREGSGVGLAICRHIVQDLGGEIRLESEGPGRGTTVLVAV